MTKRLKEEALAMPAKGTHLQGAVKALREARHLDRATKGRSKGAAAAHQTALANFHAIAGKVRAGKKKKVKVPAHQVGGKKRKPYSYWRHH